MSVLWIGLALVGFEPDGAVAQEPEDPVSAQVVRMLEAELSEEIILDWLASQPVPAAALSADELVALKKAGASDDLMKSILARMQDGQREDSHAAEPAPTGTAPPPAAPAAPPAPPPSSPAPAPSGVAAARAPDAGSMVTFRFSYLARFEEFDPEWDLFVYIDGVPLTYLTTASVETRAEKLEFLRSVPAGKHVLRVAQERHFKRRGRWQHETRMATEEFPFELEAGVPARLELEFVQRLMDYQDPLVFKLVQGEAISDSGRVGGETEYWPYLCDDIEASIAEGKKPSRQQSRRLDECVRWDGLWSETAAPSRSEVLNAMADFDFRPKPKGV